MRVVAVTAGGTRRVLSAGGRPLRARPGALSPDGRRLAASTADETIWMIDTERGTRARLKPLAMVEVMSLRWSLDGRSLLLSGARERMGYGVVQTSADKSDALEALVEPTTGESEAVGFVPDSRTLVSFVRRMGGETTFTRQEPGAEARAVFTEAGGVVGARPSPDGRLVAFDSASGGDYQVYVRPLGRGRAGHRHGQRRALAGVVARRADPVLPARPPAAGRDGQRGGGGTARRPGAPTASGIAFVSKRGDDETAALYVIPIDGGEAEEDPRDALRRLPAQVAAGRQQHRRRHQRDPRAGRHAGEEGHRGDEEGGQAPQGLQDDGQGHGGSAVPLLRPLPDRQSRLAAAARGRGDARRSRTSRRASIVCSRSTASCATTFRPTARRWRVAINSTPPPFRDVLNSDIYLRGHRTARAQLKNLTADNKGDDGSPTFAPDGKSLVYLRQRSTPTTTASSPKLWRHDLASGKNTPLTEALDYSFDEVKFSPDGKTLWLLAEDKGVLPVFKMNADGTGFTAVYRDRARPPACVTGRGERGVPEQRRQPARRAVRARPGDRRGAAAHALQRRAAGAARPGQGRGDTGSTAPRATRFRAGSSIRRPTTRQKTYPLRARHARRPAHDEPRRWTYRWNHHAFAAPGYIVACVNRHGSTGFGEKFSQSILNEWGDKPFEDIMKGTDFLLAKLPNIDPKRHGRDRRQLRRIHGGLGARAYRSLRRASSTTPA